MRTYIHTYDDYTQLLITVNLTLMTVMVTQHVILLSLTNTTAPVMMALPVMGCFVKVSIE